MEGQEQWEVGQEVGRAGGVGGQGSGREVGKWQVCEKGGHKVVC